MGASRVVACGNHTLKILFLGLICVPLAGAGGLNLNFKSQQLSNLLGTQEESKTPSSSAPSTPSLKKDSPELLRLDLSGRLQILLVGPDEDVSTIRTVRPLLPSLSKGVENPGLPTRIRLLVDYDFAQSSYGLTRLVPEYTWQLPSPYRPRQVEVAVEQGLAGTPSAVESRLWWASPEHSTSPLVRLRYENTGKASLFAWFPLHKRISYQAGLSKDLGGRSTTLPVPAASTAQDDWWIPDLSIDAMGTMQAHKQVWLPASPSSRVGFRLSFRRQLEWSLWNRNQAAEADDTTTYVSLQIQGASPHWQTGARMETSLEEPLARARLALSTRFHMGEPSESG
jgi:hypothetical protein